MADTYSFDITGTINEQELSNAIGQALKEIITRYDLKDSNAEITYQSKEKSIEIIAPDDFKLKSILEIFYQKSVKRGLSIKGFEEKPVQKIGGGKSKQLIVIQDGISKENAKRLSKDIRDSGIKVTIQIQDSQIRVTSKKIDELQAVIAKLKSAPYDFFFEVTNYR